MLQQRKVYIFTLFNLNIIVLITAGGLGTLIPLVVVLYPIPIGFLPNTFSLPVQLKKNLKDKPIPIVFPSQNRRKHAFVSFRRRHIKQSLALSQTEKFINGTFRRLFMPLSAPSRHCRFSGITARKLKA